MIDALTKTLSAILQSELNEYFGIKEVHVAFDPPVESFKSTVNKPTINLFLYDIRENTELRSKEPVINRIDGKACIQRPPLRVACSYLVTAWVNGDTEQSLLQEHQLLSQVLRILASYPTIDAESGFLVESLKTQELPLPMITAQTDALKNPHEFWSAIGGKLRPSITVTVTIGMEMIQPKPVEVNIVKMHEIILGERTSPDKQELKTGTRSEGYRIGGRVTTTAADAVDKKPVEGAIVSVKGTGLETKTDADGRYTLGLLVPGKYILWVEKGNEKKQLDIEIPNADARANLSQEEFSGLLNKLDVQLTI